MKNSEKKERKIQWNAGFTLVELIIVLAILSVLAAVAVPVFGNILERSREQADEATRSVVETAVEVYRAAEGTLPTVTGDTPEDKFNSLVTLLQQESYLKKGVIKAQGQKHFTYDDETGFVRLE